MGEFRFKQFSVRNDLAAQKVGTDAVLLGAAMTLPDASRREPQLLLDVGTGTGVIALMAAQRLSAGMEDFLIEAIDIDADAVAEASANFASSPWSLHLHASKISLQELSLALDSARYDAIFSNPPFFEDSLKAPDGRRSAARHADSLSYRDIISFAAERLNPGGTLSLILPAGTELPLTRTAKSFGLSPFRTIRIRTTPSKPFKRIIAEFSKGVPVPGEPCEEELSLMEGAMRSSEYSSLTKDFYL
ncbi:MAG: methyltransferase [Bacteroidales bacterium]|nr:methyltransferase [Bacteroidales bacterium]